MVQTAQIIDGVESIILTEHSDARGKLVALEEYNDLPFIPRRIFYITELTPSNSRACHSGNSEQLLIAINGSTKADVDNGMQQASINLHHSNQALWIRPGVWLKLSEFSAGTILLVAANLTYAETIHFNHPNFPYKDKQP